MLTFLNLGKNGRFGNQLFQIASTIGIAKKFGYQFGFLDWEFQQWFKNPLPKYTKFNRHPELRVRHLCPPCKFPLHYTPFRPSPNNSLEGLMQTEKYFTHCADLIKHYFEMWPIPDLIEIEPGATCIHYRATDYHIVNFPVQKAEYYKAALKKLKPAGPVYVFSDDLKEAKTILTNKEFIFVKTKHFMHDFYLMQQCTNFVIANSTFSWWAAWLSTSENKQVICPSVWFAEHIAGVHTDIYPVGWEII